MSWGNGPGFLPGEGEGGPGDRGEKTPTPTPALDRGCDTLNTVADSLMMTMTATPNRNVVRKHFK